MKPKTVHKHPKFQHTKGSILILVLIVTASLTIVAFSLAYRCQIELRLAHSSAQDTSLYYLAYGGIQRCLALLSQQELEPQTILHAAHFISSAQQENLFGYEYTHTENMPNLFYWITDENSLCMKSQFS